MKFTVNNHEISYGCSHKDLKNNICPINFSPCADCIWIDIRLDGNKSSWEEVKRLGLVKE